MNSRFVLIFFVGALFGGLAHAELPATPAPSAEPLVTPRCAYDSVRGDEFRFPTADRALQHYGFVLWRETASIVSDPLAYDRVSGRRGKLTGKTIYEHGINWFEALMEDCSYIYAEDASRFSNYHGLEHLKLHGKVVFFDLLAVANELIGEVLIVQGAGLESRQRLYTESRAHSYPLHDGERLTVLGIDEHRYAHAKGVGPFFFRVQRKAGQTGLIKFHPKYVRTTQGLLPLKYFPPAELRDAEQIYDMADGGALEPVGVTALSAGSEEQDALPEAAASESVEFPAQGLNPEQEFDFSEP